MWNVNNTLCGLCNPLTIDWNVFANSPEQGPPGKNGFPGLIGAQGLKGDTGLPGSRGEQGLQGTKSFFLFPAESVNIQIYIFVLVCRDWNRHIEYS